VELNERVVKRNTVDYDWLDTPRHVYRYSRAGGEVTYFGDSKQDLHRSYPNNAMPISEAGSQCVPVEDDGSRTFAKIWEAVQDGATLRRHEGKKKR
jgi:hypothetical protein